jgi:hypothetical protein
LRRVAGTGSGDHRDPVYRIILITALATGADLRKRQGGTTTVVESGGRQSVNAHKKTEKRFLKLVKHK